jgi:hypothetical protein
MVHFRKLFFMAPAAFFAMRRSTKLTLITTVGMLAIPTASCLGVPTGGKNQSGDDDENDDDNIFSKFIKSMSGKDDFEKLMESSKAKVTELAQSKATVQVFFVEFSMFHLLKALI